MEMSCQSVRQILTIFITLLLPEVTLPATVSTTYHLRKICKGSEIEILSSQGVRVEPFEKSRVELSFANRSIINKKGKFRLAFEFKTQSPNGTLFYGRAQNRPQELIALSLENGDLVYKIQCPTLHADILLPTRSMTRLNDGQWHKVSYNVTYRRHGQKGHITIDGFSGTKRYEVSCDHMTSLVMGGHSPRDSRDVSHLQRTPGHFDGCIRNVRIPTALRSPPKYYAVSVCD